MAIYMVWNCLSWSDWMFYCLSKLQESNQQLGVIGEDALVVLVLVVLSYIASYSLAYSEYRGPVLPPVKFTPFVAAAPAA